MMVIQLYVHKELKMIDSAAKTKYEYAAMTHSSIDLVHETASSVMNNR